MTTYDVMAGWDAVVAPTYEAWRIARHGFLTASDVAPVMGLSSYSSRNKVLAAKRTAGPGEDFGSKAMRGGSHQEGGVFAWFLEELRWCCRRDGVPEPEGNICRHSSGTSLLVRYTGHGAPTHLAASPDGLVGPLPEDGSYALVEVKVTSPARWLEDWGSQAVRVPRAWDQYATTAPPSYGKCPLRHWVQLQTQLACTGLQRGYIVGACGTERQDYPFAADPAFHEQIVAAARAFAAEVWA